jgi:hypothetical protein
MSFQHHLTVNLWSNFFNWPLRYTFSCFIYFFPDIPVPYFLALMASLINTLFFFFLYCCTGWGYIVALQRFLRCIKYIILEVTSSTTLLYPPSLIPGTVSIGIIFSFIYALNSKFSQGSFFVHI